MYNLFSKQLSSLHQLLSVVVLVTMVAAAFPVSVLAQEALPTGEESAVVIGCTDETADNYEPAATEDDGSCTFSEPAADPAPSEVSGCTDETATNFNADATTDDGSCGFPEPDPVLGCTDETADNYDEAATEDDGSCTFSEPAEDPVAAEVAGCTDETATNFNVEATTDDGSCTFPEPDPAPVVGCTDETADNYDPAATEDDGSCTFANNIDGVDGETGTSSDNTATTTATTTDPVTNDGDTGATGGSGADGADDQATTTHDHIEAPIPFVIDELIGDTSDGSDGTANQEDQGGERERGEIVTIETGVATAKGEVSTKANSSNIRSIADEAAYRDLDNYRFYQESPNDANVTNEVAADAFTGRNQAIARQEAEVNTGDAVATFNIANVVNTNIVNSDGYLYLANQILEPDTSLDLQDFFFPGGAGVLAEANGCTLNSCLAENIEYNFSQTNHATITNDAHLRANTGDNYVTANRADIITGDAYGAANVVNVVNTNIVDSNYRLLTFNAVGDLEGDLILPTEELFDAFFGLPNGLNQLQVGEGEDGTLNVDNQNDVDINNNVDTYAESGLNEGTAIDSSITTGRSESESNVLNKVNDNVFGGDLMYLWIRVHGAWSGDVVGLPDGLAWEWGPEGIIIYNEDAEVTPSEFLGYDLDAYTANVQNFNNVVINNNVHVDAISGRNEIDNGLIGTITTGNTFASANVMNIANTNVIGANWTMAIVNVLGDFDGNVTFARTDLKLEGLVTPEAEPIGPSTLLTFDYTVANTTDQVATNVVLTLALNGARHNGQAVQSVQLGNVAPGEVRNVQLTALTDSTATTASKDVTAVATVDSDEGDATPEDNEVTFGLTTYYIEGCMDTAASNYDETATIADGSCEYPAPPVYGCTDSSAQNYNSNATADDGSCSYGGGGGGGSPSGGGGSSRGNDDDDDDDDPEAAIERTQSEVDPNDPPLLSITKVTPNATGTIKAGVPVNYVITVTNDGGYAYSATVEDVLKNPIGEILNKDSWNLGTILPGEEIALEYTTSYQATTPSGTYTNTASLIAYAEATSTRATSASPLLVEPAVHTIEIDGVPLAVGNVAPLAYFPTGGGTIGAIFTWQTSQPSEARVHYSPTAISPFDASRPGFGYQQASLLLPGKKTTHAMILLNLRPGITYSYHVAANDGTHQAFGGPYTFRTPAFVNRLTLANQVPRVAGATTGPSITTPNQQATTVSTMTVPATTPTPAPYPSLVTPPAAPTPTPTPTPAPEPEPEPEPALEPAPEPEPQGFFGKVRQSVGGWFR